MKLNYQQEQYPKEIQKCSVKSDCSEKQSSINQQQQPNAQESNSSIHTPSQQSSIISYEHLLNQITENYRSLPDMISQLQNHGITYNCNYFKPSKDKVTSSTIRILSIQHTKHFQIVTLKVSLGPFQHSLMLYNTFCESIFKEVQQLYCKNLTSIYRLTKNAKEYIAKSTLFEVGQKQSSIFKYKSFLEVIKEYFISKIMSILKIGPRICQQFGFDLFVSLTDVFFFIESCTSCLSQDFTHEDILSLKKSLKQMHLLSILHRDIKPDNIMYSPSFKKYVFIDFGISQFRTENYSQLIHTTSFAGTYNYTIQQMKNLFKNRQAQWINLHWNDAYGLEVSIKQIQKTMKMSHFSEESQQQIYQQYTLLDKFLTQTKIKWLLFVGKLNFTSEFKELQTVNLQFYIAIMNFFYQIPLTQHIRTFYQNYIEEQVKQLKDYQDLKEIFQNRIYYEYYRGKRIFNNVEQLRNVEIMQWFYQQIDLIQNHKNQFRNLSIKKLQSILLAQKKNDLGSDKYAYYVIEYINFKRIQPKIPIETKLQVCEQYLTLNTIKAQNQLRLMETDAIFVFFFQIVFLKMQKKHKLQHIQLCLRTLENIVLLSQKINRQILQQIVALTQEIYNDSILSQVEKIELTLLINISYGLMKQKFYKTNSSSLLLQIDQSIYAKIISLVQKAHQKSDNETQIIQVYAAGLKYFFDRFTSSVKCNPHELLHKINSIKSSSRYFPLIRHFIQYKILSQIEQNDRINFQRQQKQQMILAEMTQNNEINSLLIHIILFYYKIKQVKTIKKYLGIYDSCLGIEQLYSKKFCFVRLFIVMAIQNKEVNSIKARSVNHNGEQPLSFQKLYQNNIFLFHQQLQNYIFLCQILKEMNIPTQTMFTQSFELITEGIVENLNLEESLKPKTSPRGLKNISYFQYLIRDIQIQYRKNISDSQSDSTLNKTKWDIYPATKSFHKIIQMDRSNFSEQDHVLLIFFDIIWLKYTKVKTAPKQILEYLLQRKNLMLSMFSFEKTIEKTYIQTALTVFLTVLNTQDDIKVFKDGVDLVYLIIQKKFCIEKLLSNFNELMIDSMIKLGMFSQLLSEILDASHFYTNHSSNSNILELTRFFSNVFKNIVQLDKQEQFNADLDQFLSKVDLRKIPIFGIFLAFCIQPLNRNRILKMINKSLEYFKCTGKYLVLSRLYKQRLKLKDFDSIRKKKYLLRKDARYSSAFTKTLAEMKSHLDYQSHLISFQGIFKQSLERKIIILGECCEVYALKRTTHHLSHVLNHQLKQQYF